jgi:hypothetical protein
MVQVIWPGDQAAACTPYVRKDGALSWAETIASDMVPEGWHYAQLVGDR